MGKYLISLDQSTQGTKALLFNEKAQLLLRRDKPHAQLVNDKGWVSHDGEEIYRNTLEVIRRLVEDAGIDKSSVVGIGITNQRETSLIWDRAGKPLAGAVVWQCARAEEICRRDSIRTYAQDIFQKTGMKLSPYFPAAKIAWLLENTGGIEGGDYFHGTVDTYLVYRLTGGKSYKTDYSNASRTQLFNIFELCWDEDICALFGIDIKKLPQVCDSNSCFGYTDCEGLFSSPIPIHSLVGDSHGALFGQNCRKEGMTKATYGTGSSIMLNIGTKPVLSRHGVVTSLAWGLDGKVEYVLEGNLNYTGAVISWLKDGMQLISSPAETEELARKAGKDDGLYLVPAFTGLGAPYWNSNARASVVGMDRTTGRAEFVRSGLECIAYQIADVIFAMEEDSGLTIEALRVDGSPTGNDYLMQFQSDILNARVVVPPAEELSGIGVAYMAGLALGLWDEQVFEQGERRSYFPSMSEKMRSAKYLGWKKAVQTVLESTPHQRDHDI